MNVVQEKNWIKKEIDSIDDEKILTAVKDLLSYAHLRQEHLKPMSVEELKERALVSERAIAAGNVISLEDLKKEMLTW